VQGEVSQFAWVVPFPSAPEVHKEDSKLFRELFDYVQAQRYSPAKTPGTKLADGKAEASEAVEVIARKIVGSYDTAVVRERVAGTLNKWLVDEGYQALVDGDDVVDFYRKKNYVFACIRVSDAQLAKDEPVELHPLRFSFKTGGRDGIYYPMKMTGLQNAPFDVNLYVFYGAWLNDKLNRYGYVHRGFRLNHRDWDTRECEPNAGKSWSAPGMDPLLRRHAGRIATVTKLFQKLYPGERYYLTNIQADHLDPAHVRGWKDDLWLFPYYVDSRFVPYDARPGGAAADAWPKQVDAGVRKAPAVVVPSRSSVWEFIGIGVLALVAAAAGVAILRQTGG
jgi:hypothetical protein